MMKILYGVQGTGNGHITRARAMAQAFEQQDVKVDYLFSGRDQHKYFDMECFGEYQLRKGVTFNYSHGKVQPIKTMLNCDLRQFGKDVRDLSLSGYDLVINDFEPVTAWAAKKQGIPCIGLSHQACFLQRVPQKGMGMTDRALTRWFAPANHNIGIHWYHYQQKILPPVITHQEVVAGDPNKILVYLPFEQLEDVVLLLKDFSEYSFECFHPDAKDKNLGHIQLRGLCRNGFQQAMKQASGIIANAGFELSSEALCMGRKLLIKPLHGQFEQASNLMVLEQLGLATALPELCAEQVEDWLPKMGFEAMRFPSSATPLVDWLLSGSWHDFAAVKKLMWDQVVYPEEVASKLKHFQHKTQQVTPYHSEFSQDN